MGESFLEQGQAGSIGTATPLSGMGGGDSTASQTWDSLTPGALHDDGGHDGHFGGTAAAAHLMNKTKNLKVRDIILLSRTWVACGAFCHHFDSIHARR